MLDGVLNQENLLEAFSLLVGQCLNAPSNRCLFVRSRLFFASRLALFWFLSVLGKQILREQPLNTALIFRFGQDFLILTPLT